MYYYYILLLLLVVYYYRKVGVEGKVGVEWLAQVEVEGAKPPLPAWPFPCMHASMHAKPPSRATLTTSAWQPPQPPP